MSSDMQTFETLAVRYMRALLAEADFGFSVEDAAAIVGNAGHESAGFRLMQEVHPRAGRGGLGPFQWTGPRRVRFERWCAAHKLLPSSFEAGYGFLCFELRGDERLAVGRTKRAVGLLAKVKAFELAYERAGVKAYPSRLHYAQLALAAYDAAPSPPTNDPVAAQVADTRRIQARLIELGLGRIVGKADGDLGDLTREAVKAFQLCHGGLVADGKPGPATRAALFTESPS